MIAKLPLVACTRNITNFYNAFHCQIAKVFQCNVFQGNFRAYTDLAGSLINF